ncbi:MAG: cytochrome C [Rubrivivax sp.]|nr:cytochrome C [Rubrivivax sp.]
MRTIIALVGLLLATSLAAAEPSRGQLLYDTHCIACHSTQLHWREKRVVQDWPGLLVEVGAWQARAQLRWSAADIEAVAAYLNQTLYRLPSAPTRGE